MFNVHIYRWQRSSNLESLEHTAEFEKNALCHVIPLKVTQQHKLHVRVRSHGNHFARQLQPPVSLQTTSCMVTIPLRWSECCITVLANGNQKVLAFHRKAIRAEMLWKDYTRQTCNHAAYLPLLPT